MLPFCWLASLLTLVDVPRQDLYCNGADKCDGAGGCSVHTGDPCQTKGECQNVCDENAQTCNAPFQYPCTDDNDYCTGPEVSREQCSPSSPASLSVIFSRNHSSQICNGAGSCISAGDPCTTEQCQTCDSAKSMCQSPDMTPCTGANPDQCSSYKCLSGTCLLFVDAGSSCDDGNNWCAMLVSFLFLVPAFFCRLTPCLCCPFVNISTSNDECTPEGACLGSANCTCSVPDDCSDSNPCTNDDCVAGSCVFTRVADQTSCNDGRYCNGADVCVVGVCQHAGDPCNSGAACQNVCNETSDSCIAPAGSFCSNGLFCDGPERCDASANCASSGSPPCTLGPPCLNVCNETGLNCVASAGTNCSNGVFCDGFEVCDADGSCVSGPPPCTSGVPCNSTCQEAAQNCFAPTGESCADGVWCNGVVSPTLFFFFFFFSSCVLSLPGPFSLLSSRTSASAASALELARRATSSQPRSKTAACVGATSPRGIARRPQVQPYCASTR
jgi:hypothetical protein